MTKIQMPLHCCLIVAFCFAPDASGGLIRHDRELDQYRQAASRPEFACVGRVQFADSQKYATGVLVAPRLVLTCAHVIRKGSVSDQTWLFGSQQFKAVRVFHVPGFSKDDPSKSHFEGLDLVLVELDRDATGVRPAKRYASRDEVGRQAWLIGHGVVGDGKSGQHEPATQMRLAGQNTLDAIGSDSPYSLFSDRTLMFDFDGPGDAAPNSLGADEPMDLELGQMGGDSGGGVFVETNAGLRLAGIIFAGVDAEVRNGVSVMGSVLFARGTEADASRFQGAGRLGGLPELLVLYGSSHFCTPNRGFGAVDAQRFSWTRSQAGASGKGSEQGRLMLRLRSRRLASTRGEGAAAWSA